MSIEIIKVTTAKQIEEVVALAQVIWHEHYTPIIGTEQVNYMLSTLHSSDAISDQVFNQGFLYYLIADENQSEGYIGVQPQGEQLFLSKLYLLARSRGNGLGKKSVEFIKQLATEHQLKSINLTVNIHNSGTIAAYKKIGFEITGEVCADIGAGYVMDDYTMELKL